MTSIQGGSNPIATKLYQASAQANQSIESAPESGFPQDDSVVLSDEVLKLSANSPLEDPISDDPLPTDTPDPPD